MKRLLTIAFVIAAAANLTAASNSDIWRRKPSGMAIGCDFSGGRTTSPTGHSGTLSGNATIASGTRFLALDGSGDWFSFSDSDSLDMTGDMSVSVWVKRNGNPAATETIAAKYAAAAGWLIFIDSGGKANFDGRTAGGSYVFGPETSGSICNNAWRHVCAVRSGASWNLYIDGTAVTPVSNGSHSFANGQPLSLGAYDAGVGFVSPLTGSLGEFRLYHRALASSEVLQLSNRGFSRVSNGGTP